MKIKLSDRTFNTIINTETVAGSDSKLIHAIEKQNKGDMDLENRPSQAALTEHILLKGIPLFKASYLEYHIIRPL